ncbi:hypothetical protein [Actinoallomurus sp. NPDC052274]|uniref:hypothetical protein n=1 Tax=Actinoallomurus sp. NPDC052274 TaxID=3155420 RepID=UPI0034321467
MPTTEHEAVALLFRDRPQLAADLLGDVLNFPVPEFKDGQAARGATDRACTQLPGGPVDR